MCRQTFGTMMDSRRAFVARLRNVNRFFHRIQGYALVIIIIFKEPNRLYTNKKTIVSGMLVFRRRGIIKIFNIVNAKVVWFFSRDPYFFFSAKFIRYIRARSFYRSEQLLRGIIKSKRVKNVRQPWRKCRIWASGIFKTYSTSCSIVMRFIHEAMT